MGYCVCGRIYGVMERVFVGKEGKREGILYANELLKSLYHKREGLALAYVFVVRDLRENFLWPIYFP